MKIRKNRKTIGKMSKTRVLWGIQPTTKVKPKKEKFLNRKDIKNQLKKREWDE